MYSIAQYSHLLILHVPVYYMYMYMYMYIQECNEKGVVYYKYRYN